MASLQSIMEAETTNPSTQPVEDPSVETKEADGDDDKMDLEVNGQEEGVGTNEVVEKVDDDDGEEEDGEGGEDDEEEEGEEDDEEDEDEDEEELDDEDPETIARRLGDQLWADIQRARAGTVATSSSAVVATATGEDVSKTVVKNPKEEAALATMRAVLSCAEQDAPIRARLATTLLPSSSSASAPEPAEPSPTPSDTTTTTAQTTNTLLALLTSCVSSARIPPSLAGPLSRAVLALAKSEDLFSPHALGLGGGPRGGGGDGGTTAAAAAAGPTTSEGSVVGTKRKASEDVQAEGAAKRLASDPPGLALPLAVEVVPWKSTSVEGGRSNEATRKHACSTNLSFRWSSSKDCVPDVIRALQLQRYFPDEMTFPSFACGIAENTDRLG
ncbi:hypothetical protein SCHPADRAFT_734210 [Schizopora paradoxa]|uniref:Uncharacterized protein n=1 Tax=Schizopora paradoxa TaxID=27342 RepID=A0A0H2R0D0_9AGAM|nr:hypothetical protein SCHPADRAFT_734210 [Schizopora paradoxa]